MTQNFAQLPRELVLFRFDDIKVTMAQRQTLDNDDNSDIVLDTKMRRNMKVEV